MGTDLDYTLSGGDEFGLYDPDVVQPETGDPNSDKGAIRDVALLEVGDEIRRDGVWLRIRSIQNLGRSGWYIATEAAPGYPREKAMVVRHRARLRARVGGVRPPSGVVAVPRYGTTGGNRD